MMLSDDMQPNVRQCGWLVHCVCFPDFSTANNHNKVMCRRLSMIMMPSRMDNTETAIFKNNVTKENNVQKRIARVGRTLEQNHFSVDSVNSVLTLLSTGIIGILLILAIHYFHTFSR